MAHQTWTGVPGPDVKGWLVRWHARGDNDRTVEFDQLPWLRVSSGQPIVAVVPYPGTVTGLCAVVQLDEACSQASAGRHYIVAFNPDQMSNA